MNKFMLSLVVALFLFQEVFGQTRFGNQWPSLGESLAEDRVLWLNGYYGFIFKKDGRVSLTHESGFEAVDQFGQKEMHTYVLTFEGSWNVEYQQINNATFYHNIGIRQPTPRPWQVLTIRTRLKNVTPPDIPAGTRFAFQPAKQKRILQYINSQPSINLVLVLDETYKSQTEQNWYIYSDTSSVPFPKKRRQTSLGAMEYVEWKRLKIK